MKTQNAYITPRIAALALGLVAAQASTVALAGNLNFIWAPSPSKNVGGYKLFYGTQKNNYSKSVDVGNKTYYQMAGLTDGATYYFAVKAYNAAHTSQSGFSNEVSAVVPKTSGSATTVDFSATKTTGTAPLVINFNATSPAAATSWKWSFGSSAIQEAFGKNATVTFNKPGTYTVSLTVGSKTVTKAGYIVATAPTGVPPVIVKPPVDPSPKPRPVVADGLVAAYNFEELSWNIVADASGQANHGVTAQAKRAIGKFGKALALDGVNDLVTVKDSASLDITKAYTLEAWVKPASIRRAAIVSKEQPGGSVYKMYAAEDRDFPAAGDNNGKVSGTRSLPVGAWSHLAATYDGANQRLYINGQLVAQVAKQGVIKASAQGLKIGGSAFGEFFHGLIDEVRVYNRALNVAQVKKDMATAIATSNPAHMLVGNKSLEPVVDYSPQGIAEAFRSVAPKASVLTAVQVYLDASSTATELVAGIYADNNGQPGALLAQGKKVGLKAGATNSVPVPTVKLAAGKPYWVAILGSKGVIKYRIREGSQGGVIVASRSNTLTSLPKIWATGNVFTSNGPISAYGSGY